MGKKETEEQTPSLEKGPLLYYSLFMCVLYFNVVFRLCRRSPLICDVLPSKLLWNPQLFNSQLIYEFLTAV